MAETLMSEGLNFSEYSESLVGNRGNASMTQGIRESNVPRLTTGGLVQQTAQIVVH